MKHLKNFNELNEGIIPDLFNKISHKYKIANTFRKTKRNELHITPTTWVHVTRDLLPFQLIVKTGKFIGKDEDLSQFNVTTQGKFRNFVNHKSLYFKKGSMFPGYEANNHIITTDLPDTAFQPNRNGINYDSLDKSDDVAVLKPEYRYAKNFKFWIRDTKDRKFYEVTPDEISKMK
jgi:hypothetical protein